ncbi:mitochondrial carrier protein CoAc1-like [Prosopis cineraria]|uniref:mitochondrial carrier protein CoAc1-like n=1 Tax=Prosopis cineraria TaxID=364024 RepID=UPI00240FC96E|nr:mitochondrial carrier protein CoAc1-like [Prosopis cineraria]
MLGSSPIIDFLVGSAAGGSSVLCTDPLDLARAKLAYKAGISTKHFDPSERWNCLCLAIKVFVKILWVIDAIGSIRDGMKDVLSQPAHNGIKSVLTSAYMEGGVYGLYRGLGMYMPGFSHKILLVHFMLSINGY